MSSYHELKLKTASSQFTVIPDEAFASMLSFDQWKRLLDTPYLPASPTYDITDGVEFSLRFFKNDRIVEVNGGRIERVLEGYGEQLSGASGTVRRFLRVGCHVVVIDDEIR